MVDAGGYKWWHPKDILWGFFQIRDEHIVLLNMNNWDGGWDWRFGTILDTALLSERQTVRRFFERLEPLSPVMGEAVLGWHTWAELILGDPVGQGQAYKGVLLTRYKDTTYIFLLMSPRAALCDCVGYQQS